MDLDLNIYIKDHRGRQIVHYTFTDEDLLEWAKAYIKDQYMDTECELVSVTLVKP